jgi:hypothetical protein
MGGMVEGETFLYTACFALAVLCAACTNPGNRGSSVHLDARELVDQALINGLIQLFPGYAGSALDFMSLGRRGRALIPAGRGAR